MLLKENKKINNKTPLKTPITPCTSNIVIQLALGEVKAFACFKSSPETVVSRAEDHCSMEKANEQNPLM